MINKETISLVLVTYNAEQYVEQALSSIFYQVIGLEYDVEVKIYDDCSTDNTIDIVNQNVKQSPWPVKIYINDRNLGITSNYKKICQESNTDYVMILEGDDYWSSPFHIEQHLVVLRRHREVAMSVNGFIGFKYENGIMLTNPPTLDKDCFYSFCDMIEANHIGNFSSCAFRGEYLRRINPELWEVNVTNVDDWLIGIEMSKFGLVAELQEVTTMYRLNPNSAWSSLSTKEKERSIQHRYCEYMKYLGGEYAKRAELAIREYAIYEKVPPVFTLMWEWLCRSGKKLRSFAGLFFSRELKYKIKKK